MSVKNLFPSVKPTADFNFAATKTLDPRITFSRASQATYYDGKTLAKAEENLWIGSTTIPGQAEAAKTNNAATTPSGYAACLVVPTTTAGYHTGGYQSIYVLAGLDYVFSFVTKAAGYSKIRMGNASGGTVAATFDLVALTVSGTIGGAYVSSGIDDLGDGWRRCWVKANHSTSQIVAWSNTPFPDGATVSNYGAASFTGDGVSGAYFGEFQVEQRSAFSFHTPTTTSAITNWQPALLTAPAGVPRFQHDPVSGKSLGFLSERQITNLLAESEFYNGIQTAGGVTLGKMFSPSGEVANAAVFAPGATSKYLYPKTLLTVSASTVYAVSVFVKMDDGLAPAFGHATPATAANDFYLVVGDTNIDPTTYRVQNVGNGLYRVSGSVTTGTVNLSNHYIYRYSTNSGRGFRVTGWQIEQHSKATSYLKTEGSQVTRLADTAIIEGSALDSFYNKRGGTFVADCILSIRGTSIVFGMAFGNSSTERMNAYAEGTMLVADNFINSTVSGGVSILGVVSDNQRHVIVRRCADYNWATCVNGGTVSTSASGQIGRKDRLGIGAPGYISGGRLDGPIARFAYYDELLTDAQMQALTRG